MIVILIIILENRVNDFSYRNCLQPVCLSLRKSLLSSQSLEKLPSGLLKSDIFSFGFALHHLTSLEKDC